MAIAQGGTEIWFQSHRSAINTLIRDDSAAERILGAGQIVGFYLSKAVLPLNLAFVYPRWEFDLRQPAQYLPGAALALAAAALWWQRGARWARTGLYALAYYVITLAPVMGFATIYYFRYSYVADHYQYASLPAVSALIAGVICWSWRMDGSGPRVSPKLIRIITGLLAGCLVLGYLAGVLRLLPAYRDRDTLWRTAIRDNPNAWMPYSNLGLEFQSRGKPTEAIDLYHKALSIHETDDTHTNLGSVLELLGRKPDAMRHYRRALELQPKSPQAHYNVAELLAGEGKLDEAISHYHTALSRKPDYARAHNGLGLALAARQQYPEAEKHLREAARLDPGRALYRQNLSTVLKLRER